MIPRVFMCGGMTKAAEILHVSRKQLSEVINGHSGISPGGTS